MTHSITIDWTASITPGVTYNVYRGSTRGNESDTPLNNSPIVGTTYIDYAVYPGQMYSYAITSVLNGVESSESIDIESMAVPFTSPPSNFPIIPNSDGVVGIDFGSAGSFVLLAGSTITNVPGSDTMINGDVGTYPGTSITGFGAPSAISGTFHPGDYVAASAEASAASAYAIGIALTGGTTLLGDIGGETLYPGLYTGGSVGITGTLILDGGGNTDAVWIFQTKSTLTTATNNSNVVLVGGAQAANVYWFVGSSATLGVGTTFAGNILAYASITADTNAYISGQLFAITGAITLDNNNVITFQRAYQGTCAIGKNLPPTVPNTPPAPPAPPTNIEVIAIV